jgi:hydrogenase maturation protease
MIAVIGCGNLNRKDDGVGVEVIRLLSRRTRLRERKDVHLLDAGTDGMAVMFAAKGCTTLIVVDSCRTGAEPAAIFEVPGHELEQRLAHSFNLHDFRWDHALYSGRQIFREAFPTDVTAYLIEARSIELGVGLSDDVREAAIAVAGRIEERILARPAHATAGQAL